MDNLGDLPLDLALKSRQDSVAVTLVNHHVNVDSKDNSGKCLLHKAIKRGKYVSILFGGKVGLKNFELRVFFIHISVLQGNPSQGPVV